MKIIARREMKWEGCLYRTVSSRTRCTRPKYRIQAGASTLAECRLGKLWLNRCERQRTMVLMCMTDLYDCTLWQCITRTCAHWSGLNGGWPRTTYSPHRRAAVITISCFSCVAIYKRLCHNILGVWEGKNGQIHSCWNINTSSDENFSCHSLMRPQYRPLYHPSLAGSRPVSKHGNGERKKK